MYGCTFIHVWLQTVQFKFSASPFSYVYSIIIIFMATLYMSYEYYKLNCDVIDSVWRMTQLYGFFTDVNTNYIIIHFQLISQVLHILHEFARKM